MTLTRFVLQSIRHHWRTNVGVACGMTVAAAVLVGALIVGDSVRGTLREQALSRIGRADLIVGANERFFRAALAEMGPADATTAPVLRLGGIASLADGSARAGGVQVLGVDERFFALAPEPGAAAPPAPDEVLLSPRLAGRLVVGAGDEIILRVEQPSAMPRDLVMAQADDVALALRLRVAGIASDRAYGRFGLAATQIPPLNAFVDLAWLQAQLELPDQANLLLLGGGDVTLGAAAERLSRAWTLEDAGLAVTALDGEPPVTELSSRRIFIDEAVGRAAADLAAPTLGVLTYFVNELRHGERATPYSMVTAAAGALGGERTGWPADAGWSQVIPPDLGDNGIVVNDWLADDLGIAPGDELELRYFVPGPQQRLVEASHTFNVHAVVPMAAGGPTLDETLMPAFPGLADAEHCRDWEPGIPVDLDRVEDEDEAYWDEHRGTPKAFITLAAGQRLWGNRFGALTAVRSPAAPDALATALRERLSAADAGLFVQDLRGPALAAGTSATDFGGLFLGLSIFLIAAALLLTVLLFVFGVEQRSGEIGTLLAVGFRARTVRRLLLAEGAVLAIAGAVVGAVAGLGYTRLVLWGLGTVWRGAVGQTELRLHVEPLTVGIGIVASIGAAVLAVWLAVRRQVRRPAVALLADAVGVASAPADTATPRSRVAVAVAIAAALAALAIVLVVGADRGQAAAGAFFGAGALLLIAGLAASRALLARAAGRADRSALTVATLGLRNSIRRRGRSLATIALLACGTFLVVAVGANRLDPLAGAGSRASGTGGFALIGESTLGVVHDLAGEEGRDAYGLDADLLEGVDVVPLRVREGDDASCLNLNQVQTPRLLGVRPDALESRGAFRFAKVIDGADAEAPGAAWALLARADAGDAGPRPVIPAIGDQASVTWVMHKGLGDTVEYVDERGRPFDVRIVATLANSILQGSLLIDEAHFQRLYPSESGYGMFLIDAPPESTDALAAELTRSLRDVGFEATPTVDRLAAYSSVQNTYLAIFQVLGGLGLLLGSIGLGIVVARNVMERRGEMAVLRAVGFPMRSIRWLVFSEHGVLVALGLAAGAVAALVAVIPAVTGPGAGVPYVTTALLLAGLLASGVLWVWLATVLAVRGRLIAALRSE